MEVLEAIKTRRSVRRFKSVEVPGEILERVLEAARWAPSWANTQCWRFIVVKDARIKAELAATLRGKPVDDGAEVGRNAATDALLQAPWAIIACAYYPIRSRQVVVIILVIFITDTVSICIHPLIPVQGECIIYI